MQKRILSILLLVITISMNGQDTGEDDFGAWYIYAGSNRISDKLDIQADAQFRFFEVVSNLNQILLRVSLNYKVNDKISFGAGYAYIDTDPTFTDDQITGAPLLENDIDEHRIFQQLFLKNVWGKFKIEHRYRLEQRFLSSSLSENTTEYRIRYRLQVTFPINERWFLNAYDEVFINMQEPIFGQNRLYGAIGYNFNKNINTQIGYLKNHFTGINFDRLQVAVFINTDLRKKNKQ